MKIPTNVQQAYDAAQEGTESLGKCFEGEPMFFAAADRAYLPGHVYSDAGMREVKISGYCEWHFDMFTFVPDDEEETSGASF